MLAQASAMDTQRTESGLQAHPPRISALPASSIQCELGPADFFVLSRNHTVTLKAPAGEEAGALLVLLAPKGGAAAKSCKS